LGPRVDLLFVRLSTMPEMENTRNSRPSYFNPSTIAQEELTRNAACSIIYIYDLGDGLTVHFFVFIFSSKCLTRLCSFLGGFGFIFQ
jgi:hypothetical protein